jgi:PAS domain S-box-containing protein
LDAVSALPPRTSSERDGDELETPEAQLRAAYATGSRVRVRRGAVAFCLIAIVVILAEIPLDRLRFPALANLLLRVRAGGALAFVVTILVVQSRLGRRWPRALALLAPLVAAMLLFVLASVVGEGASPFYNSVNFVLIGAALVIPWPPAWSALAGALALAGYVAITRGRVDALFLDNLSVFSASAVLAVITTFVLERGRWREFGREWALATAHRDARASAARYRSVVETAGSAIIVLGADGRVSEFNREAERVLGRSRDDAIGKDLPAVGIRGVSTSEPVRELEIRVTTPAGDERVLACNTSRLHDDLIVSAQDVTDRKRAEQALRDSEHRLRTVIANSPVVLFAIDVDGTITFSEGHGLARLGLRSGEVAGRHIREVEQALGFARESYASGFERALAGETAAWVGSALGATFECRLTPMRDTNGRVTGAIGVAIDVTEQRHAEAQRLDLERKLLESQKLESLGVLAGGVAHDFRNLLVTILGHVSLALDDLPPDSPAREKLGRIETAARRGSELARQMLAYAGRERVVLEPVDVNGVVAEMKELLRVSMGRAVRVTYDLRPDLPPVHADPTQVRQVVMNLVINAAESLGERGGAITVRTGVVDLGASDLKEAHHAPDASPGPHFCLEVADSGCGIDAVTMARIFDPFFTTKSSGRGFGLATVLGVVRGHRGALRVDSEPGRGTTFRVYLPCAVAAAERAAAPARPAGSRNEPEGRTILLVDDEEDVRAVTAHMLERLGCSVLQAGDGCEGIEVFRAHAHLIDAVLVDLTLPRLSGDQVFQAIRDIRPDARVILMSGYSNEIATRGLDADRLAGFLRKPFSVADLRSTMGRALTANGT